MPNFDPNSSICSVGGSHEAFLEGSTSLRDQSAQAFEGSLAHQINCDLFFASG